MTVNKKHTDSIMDVSIYCTQYMESIKYVNDFPHDINTKDK